LFSALNAENKTFNDAHLVDTWEEGVDKTIGRSTVSQHATLARIGDNQIHK
jgi:hypothetical protein